jgi:hypothetical protein
MYLKTTEPLYKPQIACGLVRRAGEAQQHKLLVVFRVDDSDAIQGHDSGYDSEGVKREKTVNR